MLEMRKRRSSTILNKHHWEATYAPLGYKYFEFFMWTDPAWIKLISFPKQTNE